MIHPKIKELQLRSGPVSTSYMSVDNKGELKDGNIISGYAIVWGQRDTYGTKFIRGCCTKSINDRGPKSDAKYKILMLWQHHCDDPIGQPIELVEDDYGLRFAYAIDNIDEVPSGKRAIKQVESGTLNQFSFGFNYVWDKVEYDEEDDSIICKEIELYEVSIVTRGSGKETYAIRSIDDFEKEKISLNEEIDDFIKTIPRKQQLELRQLISRHTSLTAIEPLQLRQKALEGKGEPVKDVLDLKYISQNFKL